MAADTKTLARKEATSIVDKWAAATLLTGWVPGTGFLSAGADQIMVRQVADCYGVGVFDMKAVTAQVGVAVGAGLGSAATEVLSLIPVAGWAVKAATLSGKTKLIGEAVIKYFEETSSLPD